MLASILMIIGYGIIAVPTGIVTFEFARAAAPRSSRVCSSCGLTPHDLRRALLQALRRAVMTAMTAAALISNGPTGFDAPSFTGLPFSQAVFLQGNQGSLPRETRTANGLLFPNRHRQFASTAQKIHIPKATNVTFWASDRD